MSEIKLGDICSIKSAKRIFESEYVQNGIPFIRGQEITDKSIGKAGSSYECYISRERYEELKTSNGVPKRGDILITAVGTIGNLCIVDFDTEFYYKDGNIIQFTDYAEIVDPMYLYYFMQSPYFRKQLDYALIGAVQKALTIVMLKDIRLELPSIENQKHIVNVLSTIDKFISNNVQICANLESMAKTLYDYWFVQFDFPDKEGRPYKSSGGRMVWNEELKREIPEGWGIKPLSQVSAFRNGINYNKNEIGNKDYKIINVRNISSTTFLMDESDFDTITLKSSSADKYLLKPSDIIIARSGCPGATRLLLEPSDNVIFCGFIICCSPNDDLMQYYLAMTLKQYEGTNATKTGGSILQNVSQDTLGALSVIIPKDDIIKRFNSIIEAYFTKLSECITENQQLSSLRDFLLPMLMNGQVKIKE